MLYRFFQCYFVILLLFTGPALGLDEDFDGWYEASNGDHTYNHSGVGQWSLRNGLVRPDNARSGNAVRFDDDSPLPYLDFIGLDGNGHDGGIGDLSFYYRHWDADGKAVRFRVQLNAGSGWVDVGPEVTVTSTSYALYLLTLGDPRDNLKIRIQSTAASERLIIDDFRITAANVDGVSLTAPVLEGTEGDGSLQIHVELAGSVATTAEVVQVGGSARAGLDYVLSASNVTLGAASPLQVIDVRILDDEERETAETLVLQLANVSGAPANPGADTVTLTLRDNEPPWVYFGLPYDRVEESSGTYHVPVVLSSSADVTVQVEASGCATGGGMDYHLGSTLLTFTAAGSPTQYVAVSLVEDGAAEGTEEIRFSLAAVTGGETVAPDTFSLYVEDEAYTATSFTVMSANTTSGNSQAYEAPGRRIFQALQPDVVGIQEFNVPDGQTRRSFVDTAFGTEYHFIVETGDESIPNGVISRWPITAHGEWSDTQVPNRDFTWATVDIPGPVDLHVVSVHLHSSGGASSRNIEAQALVSHIGATFPSTDYVVLCGDLNVNYRTETAVQTLKTILSDRHQPADQYGDKDTNEPRSKPYDFVLPNPTLDARHVPVEVSGRTFNNGIVFDTREWGGSPPAPALAGDSGVSQMQHMGVMKRFTAYAPPARHSLDVGPGPGPSSPPAGSYLFDRDTVVTPWVRTPELADGATQYVCVGWTGTGSVPCEGEGTTVPAFPIRSDSGIRWLWETNFLLSAAGGAGGEAVPPSQWVAAGSTGRVAATPDAYYSLSGWTGDVDSTTASELGLDVYMDRAREVEARFSPDMAARGVPHWWLASYGMTEDFDVHAAGDGDGDGEATWAEYVSGHDPTNRTSFFVVDAMARFPNMGIRVQTQPGRRYEIAFCDTLDASASPWSAYVNPAAGIYDEAARFPSSHTFEDTFDVATSGSEPAGGSRAYRVSVGWIP